MRPAGPETRRAREDLEIEGMHRESCAQSVEKALQSVDGGASPSVNIATELVIVESFFQANPYLGNVAEERPIVHLDRVQPATERG